MRPTDLDSQAIVLSIRTRHLHRILAGEKTHEFRRRRVRARPGDVVWAYEVSPVRMVTATFVIAEVVHAPPQDLFVLENDPTSRADLASYFEGCDMGTALGILGVRTLVRPLPLSTFGLSHAPQSYAFGLLSVR